MRPADEQAPPARDPEVLVDDIGVPDHEAIAREDDPNLVGRQRSRNSEKRPNVIDGAGGQAERGKVTVREDYYRPRGHGAAGSLDAVLSQTRGGGPLVDPDTPSFDLVAESPAVGIGVHAEGARVTNAAVV